VATGINNERSWEAAAAEKTAVMVRPRSTPGPQRMADGHLGHPGYETSTRG
jgi:hypothetical protein